MPLAREYIRAPARELRTPEERDRGKGQFPPCETIWWFVGFCVRVLPGGVRPTETFSRIIMQALAMLVSLPIFTLPHACPTPVVVYKTHGLPGSAPGVCIRRMPRTLS